MIIPRPGQPPRTDGQISPVPLLPLRLPPEPLRYPALPLPLRDHRFSATYNVTTHIVPAAFPPRILRYRRELISLQAQYVPDSSGTQPTVLWNVLNRYVRHGKGGGLTLLMLHANGMHKETFEPTIRHLLQAADKDTRYRIDEVWTLDAVQHGDAGLINASDLGVYVFTWSDQARDILNFILHFLPETVSPSELPTHLPRVPLQLSSARQKRGYTNRELVVIGHSFSGCAAILAAHTAPAPFSGLVLVDPVIVPSTFNRDETVHHFIERALARRSVWSSREEAYSMMSKSPFFGTWDPDAFRSYIDYALVEDSSGGVSLKCNKIQEAVVFADQLRSVEAWSVLPEIDKRIDMKWIIPSLKKTIFKSYELAQEAVWRRAENVTNLVVENAAHVIIQDSPREVAQGLHEFLKERNENCSLRSHL
ncbi:Alpha/beta hydrolase family-domain-containing protein [Russula vinacea]|nr:Alpha/beta hydrolase family-domain-containing protein [Russula vinacea]